MKLAKKKWKVSEEKYDFLENIYPCIIIYHVLQQDGLT